MTPDWHDRARLRFDTPIVLIGSYRGTAGGLGAFRRQHKRRPARLGAGTDGTCAWTGKIHRGLDQPHCQTVDLVRDTPRPSGRWRIARAP